MCRDSRWTILFIIAMLVICILTGLASAGSNVRIEASVKPSVEVVVSPDDCTWVLTPNAPGCYTKTGKLRVRSNANWMITAKDDGATGGYLREWKENGYASKKLSTPMKIRAGEEGTLPTGAQTPITTGIRTGSKPEEVDFSFTQIVTAQDMASNGESAYRMVVTFIGTAT